MLVLHIRGIVEPTTGNTALMPAGLPFLLRIKNSVRVFHSCGHGTDMAVAVGAAPPGSHLGTAGLAWCCSIGPAENRHNPLFNHLFSSPTVSEKSEDEFPPQIVTVFVCQVEGKANVDWTADVGLVEGARLMRL